MSLAGSDGVAAGGSLRLLPLVSSGMPVAVCWVRCWSTSSSGGTRPSPHGRLQGPIHTDRRGLRRSPMPQSRDCRWSPQGWPAP